MSDDEKWKEPKNWRPSLEKPFPSIRCPEMTEKGTQCGNMTMAGSTRCGTHSTNMERVTAQSKVEAARLRLIGLVDPAIDGLEELIQVGTADSVRLKAIEGVLDRAGLIKGSEVNVNVEHTSRGAEVVSEKLAQIRSRQHKDEEVIDVTEESDD